MRQTASESQDILFFVHIMKTAGTSFLSYMRENIDRRQIFPSVDDPIIAMLDTRALRDIPADRRATLRAYTGHFPAYATEIVGATKTVTLVRNPVDRVISMLKQCQRGGGPPHPEALATPPDITLEQIYEDPEEWRWFDNVQTRVFAMRAEENPKTFFDVYPLDRARLDDAKARLASFDVVGLTEDFPGAARAAQEAFGWKPLAHDPRWFVAPPMPISETLRARIAEDMEWDREFYEFATALVAQRNATRTTAYREAS